MPKKTDPNVKETDYILSKPELCRRVYPGVPFRVASNDLTRASAALRQEMYEQAVPWQLIPVTPKLGKPSTYDIKKVPQSIPVEPKNGEQTTQSPPPLQSDTNDKKEVGSLPTKARPHRKGKNAPNLTAEEKARQKMEKARRRERGEARIDQASQLEPISADFTEAILDSLGGSYPLYPYPLDSLGKDLDLITLLKIHAHPYFVDKLLAQYTVEQIGIFVITSFIKTLNDLSHERNGLQKNPITSTLRAKAKMTIDRYRDSEDEKPTEEEKLTSGIKNAALALAGHFSIPVTEKQIIFTLHPLRSVNA